MRRLLSLILIFQLLVPLRSSSSIKLGPLLTEAVRLEEVLAKIDWNGVETSITSLLGEKMQRIQPIDLAELHKKGRPHIDNFYVPAISQLLRDLKTLKEKIKIQSSKNNLSSLDQDDLYQSVMIYYFMHARIYNIYFVAAHNERSNIEIYKKGLFEVEDLNLMIHKNSLYLLFPSMENDFNSNLLVAKSAYHSIEKDYIEVKMSEFQKLKFETAALDESIKDIKSYNVAIQYYAVQKLLINYLGFNDYSPIPIQAETVKSCAPDTIVFQVPRSQLMTDLPFYQEMQQLENYQKYFYNKIAEYIKLTSEFELFTAQDIKHVSYKVFEKIPKTKEIIGGLVEVLTENDKKVYSDIDDYIKKTYQKTKNMDKVVWPAIASNYVQNSILSGEKVTKNLILERIFETMWEGRTVYSKAVVVRDFTADEMILQLDTGNSISEKGISHFFPKEKLIPSAELDLQEQKQVLGTIEQEVENLKQKTKQRFFEYLSQEKLIKDIESPAVIKEKSRKQFIEKNIILAETTLNTAYIVDKLKKSGLSLVELEKMKNYEKINDLGVRSFVDNTNKIAPQSVAELSNFYQQKVSGFDDKDYYWNLKNGNSKIKVTDLFWLQLDAAYNQALNARADKKKKDIFEAYVKNEESLKLYDFMQKEFSQAEQEKLLFKVAVSVAKKIFYGADITDSKNKFYWWEADRKQFKETLEAKKDKQDDTLSTLIRELNFNPREYHQKIWKEETESKIGVVAQDNTARIKSQRYIEQKETNADLEKRAQDLNAELNKPKEEPATKKTSPQVQPELKNYVEVKQDNVKLDIIKPFPTKQPVVVDKADSLNSNEKKLFEESKVSEAKKVMAFSDSVTSQIRNLDLALVKADGTKMTKYPFLAKNLSTQEAAQKEAEAKGESKGKIIDLFVEDYRNFETYGEAFYRFLNILGLADYVLGDKDISSGRFADNLYEQLMLAELRLNETLGEESLLNSYTDDIIEGPEEVHYLGVDGPITVSTRVRGHFIYKLLEAYDAQTNSVEREQLRTLMLTHMKNSQLELKGKMKDFCELDLADYKRNAKFRNMFNSVTEVRKYLKALDNEKIGEEERKKIEEIDTMVAQKSRSFIEMLIHDVVDPLFMVVMAVTLLAALAMFMTGPQAFTLLALKPFLAFMGASLTRITVMNPMMASMLILSIFSIMRFPINFIHKPAQVRYQESLLKVQLMSKQIEGMVDGKYTNLEEVDKAHMDILIGQTVDSFVIILEMAFFPGFVVKPIEQAVGIARAQAVKRLTGLGAKPSVKNVIAAIKNGKFKKTWKSNGFEAAIKEAYSGVKALSREELVKVAKFAIGRMAEESGLERNLPFSYLKAIDKEIARRKAGLRVETIFGRETVSETVMTAKGPATKETEQWVKIAEYHVKEHAKKDPKFYTRYAYGKDFKKWVDGGEELMIWDPFSRKSWDDFIFAVKDFMKNSSTRNVPMYVQELLHAVTSGNMDEFLKRSSDLIRRHGPIEYFSETGELIKGNKSMIMHKFEVARGMAEAKRIKDLERHREIALKFIKDSQADIQDILRMADLTEESKRLAIEMFKKKDYKTLSELGFRHEADYLQSFFHDPHDIEVFKDIVSFSERGNPLKKFKPMIRDLDELNMVIAKPSDKLAPFNHFTDENWDEFFKSSERERYAQYRDYLIELNNHSDDAFKKTIDEIDDMIK